MSSPILEAIDEEDNELTPRERMLEAYHAAVRHLTIDDVLYAACSLFPDEGSALQQLVEQELRYPEEDITRAHIHPDLAQQVALQCLRAIQTSIDAQASVAQVVEGLR